MVAHRNSRGIGLLILNISIRLGWVISSILWLVCSQLSGPFPKVNTAGWAPGLVHTGRRKREFLASHWGSNLTVQPVASHCTVYSIPSPSHTEGDGMSMAWRRGKIKKNYISWRIMWHLFHLCILESYDSCIYLLSKLHKTLLKIWKLNQIYIVDNISDSFYHCISLGMFQWSQHTTYLAFPLCQRNFSVQKAL